MSRVHQWRDKYIGFQKSDQIKYFIELTKSSADQRIPAVTSFRSSLLRNIKKTLSFLISSINTLKYNFCLIAEKVFRSSF